MPCTPPSLLTPPKDARLALVAGWGHLPLSVLTTAQQAGWHVMTYSFSPDNRRALQKASARGQCHAISPGLLEANLKLFKEHGVTHLVFAGKAPKWLLLHNPRLDRLAVESLANLLIKNDDAIMLGIIQLVEGMDIQVLPQTAFLQECFVEAGCLSRRQPSEEEWRDITLGYKIAKEMGRLDIGQSVITHQGMVLAVEALEGTDACIKRGGKLSNKKGGTLVKVAKPGQDERFDVPTVGLRTLKTMRSAGLTTLATEANATFYLDLAEMVTFANRYGLTLVSVQLDAR